MFKIGKLKSVKNENVEVQTVEYEVSSFENGVKLGVEKVKKLRVNISGEFDNTNFLLEFILNKSLKKICMMKRGSKVVFNEFFDSYCIIDGNATFDVDLSVSILRIDKIYSFFVKFKVDALDLVGESEFDYIIEK